MNKRIYILFSVLILILLGCSADNESTDAFTKKEIDAAKQVVESYVQAMNQSDLELRNSCMVPTHYVESKNEVFVGQKMEILSIELNTNPKEYENIYMYNTHGKENEVQYSKENVIVLKVDYMLNFEDEKAELEYTMPAGKIEGYSFCLVRESKDAPWLINSFGWGFDSASSQ